MYAFIEYMWAMVKRQQARGFLYNPVTSLYYWSFFLFIIKKCKIHIKMFW